MLRDFVNAEAPTAAASDVPDNELDPGLLARGALHAEREA